MGSGSTTGCSDGILKEECHGMPLEYAKMFPGGAIVAHQDKTKQSLLFPKSLMTAIGACCLAENHVCNVTYNRERLSRSNARYSSL